MPSHYSPMTKEMLTPASISPAPATMTRTNTSTPKLLFTPVFLAPLTTTAKRPVAMEKTLFTGSTTPSTSPTSSSVSTRLRPSPPMPKLLTPAFLSKSTGATSSNSQSTLTTTIISSSSASVSSPTSKYPPRTSTPKLLLTPVLLSPTDTTTNEWSPNLANQQPTSKLVTPAFVTSISPTIPSLRRHRLPIFRMITSRFE